MRRIEVAAVRRGRVVELRRLDHWATQAVLDELAGATVELGAAVLRSLREPETADYDVLRVVTVTPDGREDIGEWAPLSALIRLAEYREAELEEQRQDEERELEAVEAGERLHQQAHAPGVIS